MPFANPVLRELEDVRKVPAIRAAIIDIIRQQLQIRHGALDEWESVHFTNAVTSLALNIEAVHQPTTAWLRLCLVDLESAMLEPHDRIGPCAVRSGPGGEYCYSELVDALDRLEWHAIVHELTPTVAA
jgi:hypothetical protein